MTSTDDVAGFFSPGLFLTGEQRERLRTGSPGWPAASPHRPHRRSRAGRRGPRGVGRCRFLALYHGEALQDCCYRSAQKQLVISYDQRWPQLYERALVLASGYLPQVVRDSSDRLWLIYHNITSELADSLTQKLSLHLT